MAKLFRLTDIILLSAASVGDLLGEIKDLGGLVPFLQEARYGYNGGFFRRESYFSNVSRLLKTGYIKRVIDKNGKPYLELTSLGKEKFVRRFPVLAIQKRRWDGFFMIAVFDIPEDRKKDRDRLRIKFANLGFGMLQESVWISPYHFEEDLREFLANLGISEFVYVFTARVEKIGKVKLLAEKIWKVGEINSEYRSLKERAIKLVEKEIVEREELGAIWNSYLEALSRDPFLPAEFLPSDWARQETTEIIERIARADIDKKSAAAQK